jgi:hypothetical protein
MGSLKEPDTPSRTGPPLSAAHPERSPATIAAANRGANSLRRRNDVKEGSGA